MTKNYHEFFHTDLNFSNIDHIVIGSGISGLTAATWLAKAGEKVVVFERHYKLGGFTHSFERKGGYQWDVGVHYVGNVGKGSSLRGLFDLISNNQLEWESMGEIYDVININGKSYNIKAGKENFRKQIIEYFPDEEHAIDQYLKLVEKANKTGGIFFLEKSFKPLLSMLVGWAIRKKYESYSQRTTKEVLDQLTNNKRLKAVLCGQFGNYGLTPKHSSFAAHAMIVGHFMEGGYYPKGGTDQIGNTVANTLLANGGKIYTKANVTNIVTEKNNVKGIMIDDKFIACSSVISNTGVYNTFNTLLSIHARQECKFNLKEVKASIGHLCLYVGLDQSADDLRLPKYNIWCYENDNYEELFDNITLDNSPKKTAYISFPSAKDPEWHKKHPDKSTIQAISMGNYEWFNQFENQPCMNRDEEYKKLKKNFETTMLERLYKLYPKIKGHIVSIEVSTPLSTKHFSNYTKGEIYGLEHTPARFKLPFLRFETKIKGLRLVGQDITIVGLAGAMIAGMLCATTILKYRVWRLFREIAQEKNK